MLADNGVLLGAFACTAACHGTYKQIVVGDQLGVLKLTIACMVAVHNADFLYALHWYANMSLGMAWDSWLLLELCHSTHRAP